MTNQHGGQPLTTQQQQRIDNAHNTIHPDNFYLFGYGSNSPAQIAQRLGIDVAIVNNNCYAARLLGWERKFFSYSVNRDGSIATIHQVGAPAAGAAPVVMGIALRMTKTPAGVFQIGGQVINMDLLSQAEGVQYNKYQIQAVPGLDIFRNGNYQHAANSYAYIGNLNYRPGPQARDNQGRLLRNLQGAEPHDNYLRAIANNLLARRFLKGEDDITLNPIRIDIEIYRNNNWVQGNPNHRTFTFQ